MLVVGFVLGLIMFIPLTNLIGAVMVWCLRVSDQNIDPDPNIGRSIRITDPKCVEYGAQGTLVSGGMNGWYEADFPSISATAFPICIDEFEFID